MRELSLNILDIVQNSVSAGASLIEVLVKENTESKTLVIKITDNGKGMTPEQVENAKDPFFTTRTTRKVGMGIPLFKLAAEQTGGSFSITSKLGVGTEIETVFKTDNIDFTPLGDVASTVATAVCMNEDRDFIYTRIKDGKEFVFRSADIKKILDGVSLATPSVIKWVEDYLKENTELLERNE